jgi:hypothetical protein
LMTWPGGGPRSSKRGPAGRWTGDLPPDGRAAGSQAMSSVSALRAVSPSGHHFW